MSKDKKEFASEDERQAKLLRGRPEEDDTTRFANAIPHHEFACWTCGCDLRMMWCWCSSRAAAAAARKEPARG